MNNNYSYAASMIRDQHGSLHDRGSADAYYGRPPSPHWYPNGSYNDPRIEDLDQAQIDEYMHGYNNESDRKDWGY